MNNTALRANGQLSIWKYRSAMRGTTRRESCTTGRGSFHQRCLPDRANATLPRTIVISIIDFILFDCEEYDSFLQPLEVKRHTLLSDKMGFHFFELPKLPADVSEDNMLLLWLSLFKAETEEELEKIKEMEVPVIGTLKSIVLCKTEYLCLIMISF